MATKKSTPRPLPEYGTPEYDEVVNPPLVDLKSQRGIFFVLMVLVTAIFFLSAVGFMALGAFLSMTNIFLTGAVLAVPCVIMGLFTDGVFVAVKEDHQNRVTAGHIALAKAGGEEIERLHDNFLSRQKSLENDLKRARV